MEELIKQVQLILQQAHHAKEESRKRGEQFNVFEACGVNHYENIHSAIIADCLILRGHMVRMIYFLLCFCAHIYLTFVFH